MPVERSNFHFEIPSRDKARAFALVVGLAIAGIAGGTQLDSKSNKVSDVGLSPVNNSYELSMDAFFDFPERPKITPPPCVCEEELSDEVNLTTPKIKPPKVGEAGLVFTSAQSR